MLIILDRDGVINQDSPAYIKSPAEWTALEGSLLAITTLNRAGHQVVVATNQSGVGRGYYSFETLEKIHQAMTEELAIFGGHLDGIYACLHKPDDHCECRKPKPGLLLQIAHDFNVDLTKEAVFVGDSLCDIQAAKAADCQPVLVKTGKGLRTLEEIKPLYSSDIPVYENLSAFAAKVGVTPHHFIEKSFINK